MTRVIETEQEILDATKDGNNKLINKLQEQINEQRQSRQNAETE
jgi:hypothetical protein